MSDKSDTSDESDKSLHVSQGVVAFPSDQCSASSDCDRDVHESNSQLNLGLVRK